MPKKQNAEPEQTAEFDLKHRVTGAAVLLFFGALVLPWLLGPPSEASKVEVSVVDSSNISSAIEPASIIVDSSNNGENVAADNVEETVYISKITPLDVRGNRDLVNAANQAAASTQSTDLEEDTNQDDTDALQELVSEQKAAIASAAKQGQDDEAQEVAQPDTDSKATDLEQAKREQELQAALAAEIKSNSEQVRSKPVKTNPISVGWVVQVGLFTEKNRAIALISELKNRGFTASSSIVDTNRGKNTGTRVWLGPFSKRVSAINEQKRLKSKAGKEGFIRVYP